MKIAIRANLSNAQLTFYSHGPWFRVSESAIKFQQFKMTACLGGKRFMLNCNSLVAVET